MSQLMLVNPRKRRKSKAVTKGKTPVRRRVSCAVSTVSKKIKRYRRNPSPRLGGVIDTVKSGAIGAAGAIATEVLLSKLPIPAQYRTGNAGIAVSALGAVVVGMAVAKFAKKPALGKMMAQGGVTVALHSIMRTAVSGPMGLGYYEVNELGYIEPTQVWESGDESVGYYQDDQGF